MSVTHDAIDIWKFLYAKNARWTTIGTLILGVVFAGIGFYINTKDQKTSEELEKKRLANLSYTQQVDALNNVQGSLNNLIQFVEMQKSKLKESEDLINSLKTEQERLKPVVEADRKTVDALLELQAQRTERNASRERWYGFGLGVVSSLIASLVIAVISTLIKRRKKMPPPTATTV